MLIKVAWRNIWRNKLRSIVVTIAIALGIWAGIFASSIGNGVNKQRLGNVIDSQVSHLQIHGKGFTNAYENPPLLNENPALIEYLDTAQIVKAHTNRTLVTGMVNAPGVGKGVMIRGIVPNNEAGVTGLKDNLVDGKFFEGTKRNPILMSKNMAEDMNLKVRSKVILVFQNAEGEIVRSAFKVVGLYKTADTRNDQLSVYVRQADLNGLLGLPNNIGHEMAVMLESPVNLEVAKKSMEALVNNETRVETWKEIIPGLNAADTIAKRMNYLLLLILLAAMSFGIINTMLMAVLERVREFGMLMAVGMNKTKIFGMIMLETVFLMLTGTPVGILLSWLSVNYFKRNGLDLTSYSEGFSNMGIKPIIYPYLTPDYYPKVILLVVIAAFLAAIYPALKAIRLNPAEAIRKI